MVCVEPHNSHLEVAKDGLGAPPCVPPWLIKRASDSWNLSLSARGRCTDLSTGSNNSERAAGLSHIGKASSGGTALFRRRFHKE